MRKGNDEKVFFSTIVNFVLAIVRYLSLSLSIVFGAVTIGYLITIILSPDLTNDIIYKAMSLFSRYNDLEVIDLITKNGSVYVAVAGIASGFINSFTNLLLYLIVCRFQMVFRAIATDEMFEKKTVDIINTNVPLAIIYALAQPIFICIVSVTTGVFSTSDVRIGGIIILIAALTLKYVFAKGYEQNRATKRYDKLKNDLAAKEEENNLELLNKEAQIKELKDTIKVLKEEISLKTKETPETKEVKKKVNKRKIYKRPAKKVTK